MIPTVEQILLDVAKGTCTIEQAMRWIREHLKIAEERGRASLPTME